ncbi:thiamine pyrophosphate-binding protein [Campylobacter hyointestinalis]|uniref:thiamine pyrophosphate-binding protein n=1 Tax=Campylobacter hyointestinalis TaxID=198 RepID=UPI000DCBDA59|nr:thiamine pyrophosphate-binding protein [Campylobacter hyointestinalis]RAZ49862.1 thiamine pyrophosphate-binding protein [Campylobacter hyointestinalis subsp. lawsonii]
MKKISDYIIEFLLSHGINKTFGYIGGAVAHIYHSATKYCDFEIINCINEQGAGFAAEGYARQSGKTGVAFATSGPGATNLITPIGSCFFDSIPTMFITGQVNTYEYKYDKPLRQVGFQETDIVNVVKSIVKYAVMIDDVNNIRYELEKAYFLSQYGRKGPVLVDIPMNIQRSDINIENLHSFYDSEEYIQYSTPNLNAYEVKKAVEILNNSNRPIVLIGGGCRLSDAKTELLKFLKDNKLPLVYSLMGKDVISDEYEYNFGLIGAYGNRYGNLALANSDLIIVLGSRLDTRQTGTNLDTFAREAKIIHVDIDYNELSAKIKADVAINCDIKEILIAINKYKLSINTQLWIEKLCLYKNNFLSIYDIDGNLKLPNFIISKISDHLSKEAICVDVGQHQMWVAQSLSLKDGQRIMFSGGMGAMGFALPCSIGVCISSSVRTVVIAGDGGIQMNIQELEVVKRRKLPIKIFVMNNRNLGMVRQFQDIYFDKKYLGTIDDYSTPDFEKIAFAYGLNSRTISDFKNFDVILSEIFSNNEPELINVILPTIMTTVEPKLIVDKPIENMFPFLSRENLKELMIIDMVD